MDFSRVELSDDDQAFLDESRDFLRTHVTEDVLRRDRETGRQLRRGRAPGARRSGIPGARVEAGVRGRLQPGAAPHLGAGEATGARAVGDLRHHRHDRAVGGEVRFTGTEGRSDATGFQRPRAALPGLHRTRGRLRRRDLQDFSAWSQMRWRGAVEHLGGDLLAGVGGQAVQRDGVGRRAVEQRVVDPVGRERGAARVGRRPRRPCETHTSV